MLIPTVKKWFQIFQALRVDEVRSHVDEGGIVWQDHFCRYLVIDLSDAQIEVKKCWKETDLSDNIVVGWFESLWGSIREDEG